MHTGPATVQVKVLTLVKGSTYAPMNEKVRFSVYAVPEFPYSLDVLIASLSTNILLLMSRHRNKKA